MPSEIRKKCDCFSHILLADIFFGLSVLSKFLRWSNFIILSMFEHLRQPVIFYRFSRYKLRLSVYCLLFIKIFLSHLRPILFLMAFSEFLWIFFITLYRKCLENLYLDQFRWWAGIISKIVLSLNLKKKKILFSDYAILSGNHGETNLKKILFLS